MVKTRRLGTAKDFKPHYDNMITKFGTSFTLSRDTEVIDSTGNVVSSTTATSTIYGDFQRITDQRELAKYGLQGSGNARFYTLTGSDLQTDDIITVNGEKWQVRKRTEDDDFVGSEVSEVWLLVLLDG